MLFLDKARIFKFFNPFKLPSRVFKLMLARLRQSQTCQMASVNYMKAGFNLNTCPSFSIQFVERDNFTQAASVSKLKMVELLFFHSKFESI